ncbi:MAG: spermine synthase [Parcubacteria group bacterium Gr01-1014_18]|nr:MAG: spermine synthase [Parcubacteria group bacterium Gr01-1014_18]TSC98401.1 MAG: spermine synthase [Parcubacteria group bacterium Greene1014_20]TSD06942.1 MAG: spermine synthase [Parcubacteria group bacterium Greene0714_2]
MLSFLRKNTLYFVVFYTGAIVLVLEILAMRLLAPYYGNTLFSVSSVLSVVLAALSVGYWVGGRWADRNPSKSLFFTIIFAGGLSVFCLDFLRVWLLPQMANIFSILSGPLVSSLLLFFIPSFLLGMLSPFAIKIAVQDHPEQLGSISGTIFFYSTVGSIAGSLLSGFYLVPSFGVNSILWGSALSLLVVGALGMDWKNLIGKKIVMLVAMILGMAAASAQLSAGSWDSSVLVAQDGIYEKIIVYDGKYKDRPARLLQLDRSSSGAMFLDGDDLAYDYFHYYALFPLFKSEMKEALVLGGGAYSIPKGILRDFPSSHVDVVEIEPALWDIGKKFFQVQESDRLANYVMDGRRFLRDTDKKYDLIYSDVYHSLFSIPTHFTTVEFFEEAKSHLSLDGVFMANIIGDLSRRTPSFLLSEMRTFREAFPNSYFFAVKSPGVLEAQNIVFVGVNNELRMKNEELRMKGINLNLKIEGLSDRLIDPVRFELSAYSVYTDDYSDVDYALLSVLSEAVEENPKSVKGKEMFDLVAQQLRYGPRYPTSPGHAKIVSFLTSELEAMGLDLHVQKTTEFLSSGVQVPLSNIIGRLYPEKQKRLILGTHYDSREHASLDPKNPNSPLPGANDSASGVAVLLEVARVLATRESELDFGIDFVFFDGEESMEDSWNGSWRPLGSSYFAATLWDLYPRSNSKEAMTENILGVIVVDMVGDRELVIKKEKSSYRHNPDFMDAFWKSSGGGAFDDSMGIEILDDHTPFLERGIPAMLLLDSDYPPFHTMEDTLDKVSPESLEEVGTALLRFILFSPFFEKNVVQ